MTNVAPNLDWLRFVPYVQLLAYLGESNLPPGGLDSVRRLILQTHLRPGVSALHAGCNAGFLTREVARRAGCQVTGIDLSPEMAEAAEHRAAAEGVAALVRHRAMDMRAMDFPDSSFDVVLSGGALAFVEGHEAALAEWVRVVRPHGLLADVEFYYRESPSPALLERISRALGVEVSAYTRKYWEALFRRPQLHPYYLHDGEAVARSDTEVRAYCARMAARSGSGWAAESRAVLEERLCELFLLFNENVRHLGYVMIVCRRAADDGEPMLYG